MRKIILFFVIISSAFAGRDDWTFANDSSSTVEISIWANASPFYSASDIVQPGSKITVSAPPDSSAYTVYADNRTTRVDGIWSGQPDPGLPDRIGQHRVWHMSDADPNGVGTAINFRELYPTDADSESDTAGYTFLFLIGMSFAATVRLVRIGLRWSRSLLADQDGS